MTETLILNQNYSPMGTIPWQRAIVLLFESKAEIVEEYKQEVRSVSKRFKMPAVIRLLKWIKTKFKSIRFNKTNVYIRDRGCCQYCKTYVSREESTFDHVIPKSRGGKTDWDNIVTCCYDCNQAKDCRTPTEAKMTLLGKPGKPTHLSLDMSLKMNYNKLVPESWKEYMGLNG